VSFSTSLGLVRRNGVDVDKFMALLRPSALYAPTFDKKLQRMLDRNYDGANFPTKVRWSLAAGWGKWCASALRHSVSVCVYRICSPPFSAGASRLATQR
jgi:hypothetical protein